MSSAQPGSAGDLLSEHDLALLRVLDAELRALRLLSREHKQTIEMLTLLVHLSYEPGSRQIDVEDRLDMSTKTVRQMLDVLCARDLARRPLNEKDRRKRALSLTPAGAELALKVARRLTEARDAELDAARRQARGLGETEQLPPGGRGGSPRTVLIEQLLDESELALLV